jgi:hypothetical protein
MVNNVLLLLAVHLLPSVFSYSRLLFVSRLLGHGPLVCGVPEFLNFSCTCVVSRLCIITNRNVSLYRRFSSFSSLLCLCLAHLSVTYLVTYFDQVQLITMLWFEVVPITQFFS